MMYDGNTYHVVGVCSSGEMCLATRNGNIIGKVLCAVYIPANAIMLISWELTMAILPAEVSGLWHTQSLQVLIGKMMVIKSLDFCYGACFFRQHLVEMVISFWLLEVGLLQGISPR